VKVATGRHTSRARTMGADRRRRRRRTSLAVVVAMAAARAVRGDGDETAAVMALARALGHDDATASAMLASDACEVVGVTCACDDDDDDACVVVRINLSGMALRGRLPGTMPAALRRLRSLDLSDNAIRGPIPEGFLSAIPNVEELYLNLNTLEGAIPPGIGRLTRLEVLNLDGGFTQTQRRFEPWVDPERRNTYGEPGVFFGNQLTGSVPSEIGNLRRLRVLNLHRNMLGAETDRYALPESVANLRALEFLDASGNQLHGAIPRGIATLPMLRQLNLDDNFLTGEIPGDWSQADSLESLVLEGNRLQGHLPAFLPRNLTFLDVHENFLTGSVNEPLIRLKRLEGALLDRCRFSGPVTLSRETNPNLKLISLANNAGLCGATPELPAATRADKDAECDKPWELCQLWPELAGTALRAPCECATAGSTCSVWSSDGPKELCCEEGDCVDVPYVGFGVKVCVPCAVEYQQCGGKSYDGPACCKRDLTCTRVDDDRYECLGCARQWEQCGGLLYDGPKCCAGGDSCVYFDTYYSQCQPTSQL